MLKAERRLVICPVSEYTSAICPHRFYNVMLFKFANLILNIKLPKVIQSIGSTVEMKKMLVILGQTSSTNSQYRK